MQDFKTEFIVFGDISNNSLAIGCIEYDKQLMLAMAERINTVFLFKVSAFYKEEALELFLELLGKTIPEHFRNKKIIEREYRIIDKHDFMFLEEHEKKECLEVVLKQNEWSMKKTAYYLRSDENSVYRLIRKYKIQHPLGDWRKKIKFNKEK